MRNSFKIATIFYFLLSFFIISCQPEEPVYTLKYQGPISIGNCFFVVCPETGIDCRDGLGVITNPQQREILDSFYSYHARQDVSTFFTLYNWESIFPDINLHHIDIQSILNGSYKIEVLSDSSIVFLNSPNAELNEKNILFVYDFEGKMACQN